MTENAYIELWNSDDTVGGKFAVIRDGRQRALNRKSTVKETFDGGLDVTMGGVHEVLSLIVRVRETEDRVGYGDLDDLETLYRYNNPNGTPSNVITYTDNLANEYSVYLIGEFRENLLGVRMTGTNSFYLVQINLRIIPS